MKIKVIQIIPIASHGQSARSGSCFNGVFRWKTTILKLVKLGQDYRCVNPPELYWFPRSPYQNPQISIKQHFHRFFAQNDVFFSKKCSKSLTASLKNVTFLWILVWRATLERICFFPTNWNKNFNVLTIGYRVFKTSTKVLLISAYPWFAILSCLEATPQTNYQGKNIFFWVSHIFNIDLDGLKIWTKKRRFF